MALFSQLVDLFFSEHSASTGKQALSIAYIARRRQSYIESTDSLIFLEFRHAHRERKILFVANMHKKHLLIRADMQNRFASLPTV